MKKSIAIIISVLIVLGAGFLVASKVVKTQKNSGFTVVELNDINNTEKFLWSKAYVDTSWFDIPIKLENSNINDRLKFSIYEHHNQESSLAQNCIFIVQGNVVENPFTLIVSEIRDGIEVGIVSAQAGTYRYSFQLEDLSNTKYDIVSYVNTEGVFTDPHILEVKVNNQNSGLKNFLLIFLTMFLVFLVIWFGFLKNKVFPSFSEGGQFRYQIGETSGFINLDFNSRRLVIGSAIDVNQNLFQRLFCGPIQQELLETKHSVEIHPEIDSELGVCVYSIFCIPRSKMVEGRSGNMKNKNNYKIETSNEVLELKYINLSHV